MKGRIFAAIAFLLITLDIMQGASRFRCYKNRAGVEVCWQRDQWAAAIQGGTRS